jgi:hypothetical protein
METMGEPPIDQAAALYREAPETFIQARNALATQLREQDRPDEAAAVKALRKPTVPAWALNQLAARDPDGVGALLDAGAELRAAQQAAVSSDRKANRLREATDARRGAVARLMLVAERLFDDTGRAAGGHLDEVRAALETASVDEEAGERLRAGTFERPPEVASGFDEVFGLTVVAADQSGASKTGRAPSTGTARSRSKATTPPTAEPRAILRAEVAKLRRDRDAAVRKATTLRGRADAFTRELAGTEARLEKIRAKHADADAAAAAQEADADRAERALASAVRRLERS